jgi:hypothetical protein
MDLSIFPVSSKLLFSLVGSAVLATVVLQYLKQYITAALWINLIDLVINLAVFLSVAYFLVEGDLGERMLAGGLIGLFGAALACYGYEVIKNALEFTGVLKK